MQVVLAGFIGTAIEWYDFFLYGTAAALVFNRLFFPNLDPFYGVMASFSTYAVGFFARPLGGVIFGHFGDRIGRKSMLVLSLIMMGVATLLIGLLPTYETIGPAAAVLLVVLRVVQGFGVGGEWGGAVLLAVEHSDPGRRGWYASWIQVGVPAGLLLATGVFGATTYLPEADFLLWGWRLPFLGGGLLMAVGMFIRMRILESPVFLQAQSRHTSAMPIVDVLTRQLGSVLLAMGARMAENVSFYLFTVFILTYATGRLGLARDMILYGVLIGAFCQLVTIPVFGILSDRIGRRGVYLFGAIGMGLFALPFFWLVDTGEVWLVWLALGVGLAIFHAAMYGTQGAFFAELFPTRVRYSGASLGYQLASPLAGGIAPLIAAALLEWSGGASWPVACYLIVMCAITALAVHLASETFKQRLERAEET